MKTSNYIITWHHYNVLMTFELQQFHILVSHMIMGFFTCFIFLQFNIQQSLIIVKGIFFIFWRSIWTNSILMILLWSYRYFSSCLGGKFNNYYKPGRFCNLASLAWVELWRREVNAVFSQKTVRFLAFFLIYKWTCTMVFLVPYILRMITLVGRIKYLYSKPLFIF